MPKRSCKELLIIYLCAFLSGLPVHGSSESKTVAASRFEQKSISEGSFIFLISDIGVRVDFPQQNIVCLAAAPNWQPKIINLKSKTGFELTRATWFESGYHVADQKQTGGAFTQHPELWHGKPAVYMTRNVNESDPLRSRAEMLFRDANERGAEYKGETILLGDWLKFKPEVLEFIRGLYHLKTNNIVLQRAHVYPSGRIDTILDTLSYKQVTVPVSEYADPIVYKKVDTKDGVTFEKRRKKEAFGILEDLFDNSENGKKWQKAPVTIHSSVSP